MAIRVVVLAPGLLASGLALRLSLGVEKSVWLSPTGLAAGLFRRMALPLPDQPDLPPPINTMNPGTPLFGLYGLLATFLRSQGYVISWPRLDWRQPLAADGERLLATVRVASVLGPVGIVAHSRGGLLARYVLGRLAQAGETYRVAKVVCLGTPHTGSLNAVINLACYGALKDKLRALNDSVRAYGGWGLGFDDVARVIRSWPSVYELLPDPARSWLPAAVASGLYQPEGWSLCPRPPYQPHLAAAAANWLALPPVPEGFPWLDIAGYGIPTAVGVEDPANLHLAAAMDYSDQGDSTVPVVSATAYPRRKVLTPCAHDVLPMDGRTWPYIAAWLSGTVPADVTIEGRTLIV